MKVALIINKTLKMIDSITVNLFTIIISGVGIFTAITKFNIPELNTAFWGKNPFAIKQSIIENTMTLTFSSLAIFGLFLQVLKEIHVNSIPNRLYKTHHYYFILAIGILLMCAVVPILTGLGNTIAKNKWLPIIIKEQKEVFLQTSFIIEHDGWRKDQLKAKDKINNPQYYIDLNYQTADENIGQMEKLLEINNSLIKRNDKIKNLRNYFVNYE
ncbi:MAG: hypothetical protein PHD29_05880 [bacterium]|nr:hypothetical protein [bacterium]